MICPGERRACRDGTPEEASRQHVFRVEADSGKRPDLMSSQEREGIPRLRKETYELRCANEILKSAWASLSVLMLGRAPAPSGVLQEEGPRSARVCGGWRSPPGAGAA
jgi:hypothetical protein